MIGREVPKDAQGRDLEPGGIGFNRRGMPKSLSGPAAEFMPPPILAAMQPRPPLAVLPVPVGAPWLKRHGHCRLSGLAGLVSQFEAEAPEPLEPIPTRAEYITRKRAARAAAYAPVVESKIREWKPRDNPDATRDAYKTIFVGRLAYETTEKRLEREMASFGAVAAVKVVRDKSTAESRGYGFVEFASEEDMKRAYKRADGLKLDGRRILVDVERGRTVRGWLPRRLGGGLGDTRRAKPTKRSVKEATWVKPPIGAWSMLASVETKAAAARAAAGGGVAAHDVPVRDSRAPPTGPVAAPGGAYSGGGYRDRTDAPPPRARSRSRSRGR